jgi:hypothetical protein
MAKKKNIGWIHPEDSGDEWDGFNDPGIAHFEGSPIRYLAREVTQNSLDAADGPTVRVKFKHMLIRPDEIPDLAELQKTIKQCKAQAAKEGPKARQFFEAAEKELARSRISILQISDSDTKGVRGPVENGTPYYALMKAKGQSVKPSDTASGSFGIGKFAPFALSRLRTVFVSTVFEDETGKHQQLTQGKSVLMSHDTDSIRRRGNGFWGYYDRCQPVSGVIADVAPWVQRANNEAKLQKAKGTTLTILGFDLSSTTWQEDLAASVAENFFGAIVAGKLEVNINDKHQLSKDNIAEFFENEEIRQAIEGQQNEPEQFENSRHYLTALTNTEEVVSVRSEQLHLGLVELRIYVNEELPKKVCFLRNGMFITDSLSQPGLKSFSDFKEFVAVVECKTDKGRELLRAMEPPRHDNFEPAWLSSKEEQTKGAKALKDLAAWIREMLKRNAKNETSAITTLDELKEYFADESGEGGEKGTEEMNPYGKIIVRAKALAPKKAATAVTNDKDTGEIGSEGSGLGESGEGDQGGGGGNGAGGGDGRGGHGNGEGGEGNKGEDGATGKGDAGGSKSSGSPTVAISNVRALVTAPRSRRIFFTPAKAGRIALSVLEAGADSDYEVGIQGSDQGTVANGKVILDTSANKRVAIEVTLTEDFSGALKVIAHEI